MKHLVEVRINPRTMLLIMLIISAGSGCSSGPGPLSIKMYNPKTHQALDCAARDQTGRTDTSVLAAAVESCAQGLESRGFIRQ